MQKCSMWKPEADNQTLPSMEGQFQKKYILSNIKTLLGRDWEVEKVI